MSSDACRSARSRPARTNAPSFSRTSPCDSSDTALLFARLLDPSHVIHLPLTILEVSIDTLITESHCDNCDSAVDRESSSLYASISSPHCADGASCRDSSLIRMHDRWFSCTVTSDGASYALTSAARRHEGAVSHFEVGLALRRQGGEERNTDASVHAFTHAED
jgi:hypothetical protein